MNNLKILQRRYLLKFATDGAVLTNTKSAVQGSMKLIPTDVNGKVLMDTAMPEYLDKEITLYYYIGTHLSSWNISSELMIRTFPKILLQLKKTLIY